MTEAVRRTSAAYAAIAAEYARRNSGGPGWLRAQLDDFASGLPRGAVVADIGCGPGVHTRLMRARGLRATGFDLSAEMLAAGEVPDLVQADMRTLPLADGSVDGIWCVAALLHLPRAETPVAVAEFARVLRAGAPLRLQVAEGDGEGWEPVAYRPDQRRWYTRHRLGPLTGMLEDVGFDLLGHERRATHRDWLLLRGIRR